MNSSILIDRSSVNSLNNKSLLSLNLPELCYLSFFQPKSNDFEILVFLSCWCDIIIWWDFFILNQAGLSSRGQSPLISKNIFIIQMKCNLPLLIFASTRLAIIFKAVRSKALHEKSFSTRKRVCSFFLVGLFYKIVGKCRQKL